MEQLTLAEWAVLGLMMILMVVVSIIEDKDIRRKK